MMIDKRLLLALPALALLAACGSKTSGNDSRAASGEVLEGTISDEMLATDRVRSEPPLEDPEAFAKVRSKADGAAGDTAAAEGEEGEAGEEPAADGAAVATPEPPPQAAGE
jgi:hypothetical protein